MLTDHSNYGMLSSFDAEYTSFGYGYDSGALTEEKSCDECSCMEFEEMDNLQYVDWLEQGKTLS
jgi:hypothetical protein